MKQEVNVGAAPGLCRPPQEVLLGGPCDLLPSCYIHAHILGVAPPTPPTPQPPPHPLTAAQSSHLLPLFALSITCECERRPPIKSHLKASLRPCASCVRVLCHHVHLRQETPPAPQHGPPRRLLSSYLHVSVCGYALFNLCACQHELTCVCAR